MKKIINQEETAVDTQTGEVSIDGSDNYDEILKNISPWYNQRLEKQYH